MTSSHYLRVRKKIVDALKSILNVKLHRLCKYHHLQCITASKDSEKLEKSLCVRDKAEKLFLDARGLRALITHRHDKYNIKLTWALFVTYTIIQSITSSEMCSLHLTHPSAHTPVAVGSRWCSTRGAVGGLVGDNSCRSRDSNPQPWVTSGFKSNALSIRPRLPQ